MKTQRPDSLMKKIGRFLRVGCCVLAAAGSLSLWGGTGEATLAGPLTVVALKAQTITFKTLPVVGLGDPAFAPGATASSLLPVSYTSSNPQVAVIENGKIRIVAAGTSVITASQSGDATYKAATAVKQTLTVKLRLTANASGGTVTGAGLYAAGTKVTLTPKPATGNTFLRWENKSQVATRSLTMPGQNVTVTAYFASTASIQPPVIVDPGPQSAMVGVSFALQLDITSSSLPTVTVTGLPAGLKFDAATNSITGVPTAAGSKSVTITAKNVNKTAATRSFSIGVSVLPATMIGTFDGWCLIDDNPGTATLTVTNLGKITGKLVVGSTTYSFTAPSFDGDSNQESGFGFSAQATAGKSTLPLQFSMYNVGAEGLATLAQVDGWSDANSSVLVAMYRNVWKDAGMVARAAEYAGYYTATLADPDGACGSGYLAFTIDKSGGVKTAGKLADGTTVSLSSTLILDGYNPAYTILYLAPAAYNGGCFFGKVEFFFDSDSGTMLVDSLNDFWWENRNPQATDLYDCGFFRTPVVSGGMYNKLIDLRQYYENGLMVGGVYALPGTTASVKFTDYNYESPLENPPKISWTEPMPIEASSFSPNGLMLTVTPAKGPGTGLAAPKADTPMKEVFDGMTSYYYDTDSNGDEICNTSGLTMTFTQATGIFKGTFNIYYDYMSASDMTTYKDTWAHTVKSVSYEGVLTPERPDKSDGIEGRGFFLWADQSSYFNPQDKEVPYNFNSSYDFQLLMP